MSGENNTGQMRVKEPRQRVAKRLVAKIAPAARETEEVRELRDAGEMWKSAPAAGDLRGREKRKSQKRLKETKQIKKPTAVIRDLREKKKRKSKR